MDQRHSQSGIFTNEHSFPYGCLSTVSVADIIRYDYIAPEKQYWRKKKHHKHRVLRSNDNKIKILHFVLSMGFRNALRCTNVRLVMCNQRRTLSRPPSYIHFKILNLSVLFLFFRASRCLHAGKRLEQTNLSSGMLVIRWLFHLLLVLLEFAFVFYWCWNLILLLAVTFFAVDNYHFCHIHHFLYLSLLCWHRDSRHFMPFLSLPQRRSMRIAQRARRNTESNEEWVTLTRWKEI